MNDETAGMFLPFFIVRIHDSADSPHPTVWEDDRDEHAHWAMDFMRVTDLRCRMQAGSSGNG